MRIPIGGVHFNVEQTGDGPPLMLLHGFTGSCDTWSTFVSSLGRHFRMIAVDLPGHGLSDIPADPRRFRMDRASHDLLALLDWLGLDRISLLGYSMGGRLALHLALAAPDRIRALVLESTSPGILDSADRAARRKADEDLALLLEHEDLETFVDRWERQSLFASQAHLPPTIRDGLRGQRLRNNSIGLAQSLRGAGAGVQEPLWGQLSMVYQPTLVITGADDAKYRQIGRELAGALPAASFVVIPDSGHAVHLEQPLAFERHVLHFLKEKNHCP